MRRFGRRWDIKFTTTIVLFAVLVGPWPTVDSSHSVLGVRPSMNGQMGLIPHPLQPGQELRAGVAVVDLAGPAPVPVAGFIDQIMTPSQGQNSTCAAKALTLTNGSAMVTILAVDMLLVSERMTRAIFERTGLPREQIFLTSTHTHSGPGGWGNHPLERLVSGTFDPVEFDHLTDCLTQCVLDSRSRLEPVNIAFLQVPTQGMQQNRIMPGQATNDILSAWIFRRRSGTSALATLAVFGAHATISHPKPPRMGGDYPGAFANALGTLVDPGLVLFAAGSVGDASPVRPTTGGPQQRVEQYGSNLAHLLADHWGEAKSDPSNRLATIGLGIDLPPVQLPFLSDRLRFSPLATWWIGKRQSYLHLLRVGPAILVGFPGDYSGELAAQLDQELPVVATSFNGDYKGYLVSSKLFRARSAYETRFMNFFGANLGDDLTTLANETVRQMVKASR